MIPETAGTSGLVSLLAEISVAGRGAYGQPPSRSGVNVTSFSTGCPGEVAIHAMRSATTAGSRASRSSPWGSLLVSRSDWLDRRGTGLMRCGGGPGGRPWLESQEEVQA